MPILRLLKLTIQETFSVIVAINLQSKTTQGICLGTNHHKIQAIFLVIRTLMLTSMIITTRIRIMTTTKVNMIIIIKSIIRIITIIIMIKTIINTITIRIIIKTTTRTHTIKTTNMITTQTQAMIIIIKDTKSLYLNLQQLRQWTMISRLSSTLKKNQLQHNLSSLLKELQASNRHSRLLRNLQLCLSLQLSLLRRRLKRSKIKIVQMKTNHLMIVMIPKENHKWIHLNSRRVFQLLAKKLHQLSLRQLPENHRRLEKGDGATIAMTVTMTGNRQLKLLRNQHLKRLLLSSMTTAIDQL